MIDRHLLYAPRLGHQPSRWRLQGAPVVTVLLGSLVPMLPLIAQSPVLPPFGLLALLAWRLLRPELWRAWIGLPLGLFDDMMSGQPIGSAVFLWTVTLIAIDYVEQRLLWRDWKQDWLIAAGCIIFCQGGAFLFAHFTGGGHIRVMLILPPTIAAILLFPAVARQCAHIDRWRLMA